MSIKYVIFLIIFPFNVFAVMSSRKTQQELNRIKILEKQEASRTPAQRCSKKDFSKQLGPIRTQGVGNCYAYQAADLLTHKLKLKPPEQVSATELSIRFSTFAKDTTKLFVTPI